MYHQIKQDFKAAFKQILKEGDSYALGEAALPAYSHNNPLIDWLFWQRIKLAFEFALNKKSARNVLDFGCGSGVLSYMLAQESFSVTACDVEFSPLHLVQKKIDFPNDIDFIEGDILDMELPKNSFDIIFALDVLEHIDSIETYIVLFEKLLKPDGVIVVSGPTENVLYKIGRKIAGSRFQGDYHVTNISLIKASFKKLLTVSTLKKLVFPIVLFEMFTATKKKIEAE